MTTNDGTVGRYLGWFLVALSLGAGVIHFAHAGEHFDLTWYHGTFFAVVAWLQLSWAAAVVVRPTRRLLLFGVLGNLAVIATWVVSRTVGLPFGPTEGEAESIALSDGLATGFEAGIVLISLAVLLRPALAQQSIRPALGFGGLGVAGAAVAVVSTMALTPSFAAEHSHGEEAADHHAGTEAAAADHHAGEGAEAAADGHGEHEGVMIMADGSSPCEKAGITSEGNASGSGHGHRGPIDHQPLTPEEQATFKEQAELADQAVEAYPTVADAEAAGWRRITPYVPCIAAHYLKSEALANPFDPAEPEILLYAGTEPDSPIVGLSYLQFSDGEPEGFAGPNDPWHVHESLCLGGGGVLGDTGTSDEDCEARGGRNVPLGNLWMTHMWNVPGWDSYWGLFSSEHPDLGGTMGNING
ncbi:MAG TPA: hypothetical protein VIL36_03660 [Acidimicrobiales bacterium]